MKNDKQGEYMHGLLGCYAAYGGLKPTFPYYLSVQSSNDVTDRYSQNVGFKLPHAA
jgi:hypothetical protein